MSKNNCKNIVICGLGGQGIMLLGKIMSNFYLKHNYEIKILDIMGLGQRGGEVSCHLRYSDKPILSPLIGIGNADYIISLELNETIRNISYLKKRGVVITSNFELTPSSVNIGLREDLDINKLSLIKQYTNKFFVIDSEKKLLGKFSATQLNIVMLGFFTAYMKYNETHIMEELEHNLNSNVVLEITTNFNLGKNYFDNYEHSA